MVERTNNGSVAISAQSSVSVDTTVPCDVCCADAGRVIVERWRGTFGSKIAPEVIDVARILLARRLALCPRCYTLLRSGEEVALRDLVACEFLARGFEQTERAPRYLQSETALTLASWTLAPFAHATVSAGFAFFNAVVLRYPRATFKNGHAASVLERDLGNGVVGVFTVQGGIFVIDNFVSDVRGQGHARSALHELCSFADQREAVMAGCVEPNAYGGTPIGPAAPKLLEWYAREGFQLVGGGQTDVLRMPQTLAVRA